MKRRGFIRSIAGGVAVVVVAPFVAKAVMPALCRHLAFLYSPFTGTYCLDCGAQLSGTPVGASTIRFVGSKLPAYEVPTSPLTEGDPDPFVWIG